VLEIAVLHAGRDVDDVVLAHHLAACRPFPSCLAVEHVVHLFLTLCVCSAHMRHPAGSRRCDSRSVASPAVSGRTGPWTSAPPKWPGNSCQALRRRYDERSRLLFAFHSSILDSIFGSERAFRSRRATGQRSLIYQECTWRRTLAPCAESAAAPRRRSRRSDVGVHVHVDEARLPEGDGVGQRAFEILGFRNRESSTPAARAQAAKSGL